MKTYKNLTEDELRFEKEKTFLSSLEKFPFPSQRPSPLTLLIIAAFVLSLGACLTTGFLYNAVNAEKRQRQAIEASQVQIQEKAQSFEKSSTQYRAEIDRMSEQLKNYAEERRLFIREIDAGNKKISELQKRIQAIEDKSKAIEEQASSLQTSGAANAVGPKAARVLNVNRKFNFVVVNIGLQDKLKSGDTLDIQRSGKTTATIRVEKIYDRFAAATILKEDPKAPIKEGDLILRSS